MARYDKSLLCFEWLDSTKIPKALRAADDERSRQKKIDVAFLVNLRSSSSWRRGHHHPSLVADRGRSPALPTSYY